MVKNMVLTAYHAQPKDNIIDSSKWKRSLSMERTSGYVKGVKGFVRKDRIWKNHNNQSSKSEIRKEMCQF